MIIKGKVLDVEHVDYSNNGNARKRVFVLTGDCQLMSAYTKVDDSQAVNIQRAIGKRVTLQTKMVRNKLTITSVKLESDKDRENYIKSQFERLGEVLDDNLTATIQVVSARGRTSWLNLSADQLAQIEFILK